VALNTGNRSLVSADRAVVHPIQQQAATAETALLVAVEAVEVEARQAGAVVTAVPVSSS